MKPPPPIGFALVLLLAGASSAVAQEPGDHYTTPGWYRYVIWHSEDGQEEWDRYIEAGPFTEQAACEATLRPPAPDNDQHCEYFDSNPEA